MKRYDFNEQLERGKKGEEVVISILKEDSEGFEFVDVSKDKEYMDKDIDVLKINKETGEIETIEIKCDETKYKSWNIFAEFCSCKRLNSPGWLKKSKADYIAYCFTKRGRCFIIPRQDIIDLTSKYSFRIGEAFDKYKVSQGYLVPVDIIEKYGRDIEKYNEMFINAYGYKKK